MEPKSTIKLMYQPYFNNTKSGPTSIETLIQRLLNKQEIYSKKALINKLEEKKDKIFECLIEDYTKPVYLNEGN